MVATYHEVRFSKHISLLYRAHLIIRRDHLLKQDIAQEGMLVSIQVVQLGGGLYGIYHTEGL